MELKRCGTCKHLARLNRVVGFDGQIVENVPVCSLYDFIDVKTSYVCDVWQSSKETPPNYRVGAK